MPVRGQGPAVAAAAVVFLGDSITRGVRPGVTAVETFASLVPAWLAAAGLPLDTANLGIGGECANQALARLQRDVLSRKPRVVLVMYGTNDSDIPAGKSEPTLPLEAYQRTLREIISQVKAAGSTPVLMTSIPWCLKAAERETETQERGHNHMLSQYIHASRVVALETGTPLIDHYAVWAEAALLGTDLNQLTTDGCHPNPAGHRLMARTIYPVLARLLGVSPDLPADAAPPAPPPAVDEQAAGNLARRCTYQESSANTFGYGPGLTDGIKDKDTVPGVYATGDEPNYPKTTTIDLREVREVGRVVIHNSTDGSTKTVTVSLSTDGATFTEIGRHGFGQGDGALATLSFPPVPARFVRLSFLDTWGNETHGSRDYMFLREAEVFSK
jgi:acyl-CoA thioesterase-1